MAGGAIHIITFEGHGNSLKNIRGHHGNARKKIDNHLSREFV